MLLLLDNVKLLVPAESTPYASQLHPFSPASILLRSDKLLTSLMLQPETSSSLLAQNTKHRSTYDLILRPESLHGIVVQFSASMFDARAEQLSNISPGQQSIVGACSFVSKQLSPLAI
jgi:hypothetical protein